MSEAYRTSPKARTVFVAAGALFVWRADIHILNNINVNIKSNY